MKNSIKLQLVQFALVASASGQAVILVGPNEGNNAPIDSITFNDTGAGGFGAGYTQTSSQPNSANYQRSTPVTVESITLQNGDILNNFNFEGARITLGNLGTTAALGITGIGAVAPDGTQTELNGPDGRLGFVSAAESALQNSDINTYIYYDGDDPPADTVDFSINFRYAFQPDDYILMQERNGNTFFELTALDINGNPILGTNVLKFGEDGGSAFSVYDWNSGFANAGYFNTQEFAFSVASASKFFEGTGVTPEPIFGFAIDNDGNADVKFFGVSETTFTDNPIDPTVPEPSSAVLVLLGALGLMRRRRP